MKELPNDLAAMHVDHLVEQRAVRDDYLGPLFPRWPTLSRIEMRRLKTMYAERVGTARHLGKLRLRRPNRTSNTGAW